MTNLHKAGRMLQFWGWIQMLLVANVLLVAWITSYSPKSTALELDETLYFIITGLALLTISGILSIVVGRHLKYQKLWSKISTLIISAIDLFFFPIGTFFSSVIIMYLYRGWNDEPFKI